MMRAGGYLLFIILIHDVKDLKTYKTQLSYMIMLLVFCFSSLYWLVYCYAWTASGSRDENKPIMKFYAGAGRACGQ